MMMDRFCRTVAVLNQITNNLTQRALAAYFRGGSIIQSWQTEAVEPVGNWYSVLVNVKGVLAVYRNREVNGESVLNCLKRWPKEARRHLYEPRISIY